MSRLFAGATIVASILGIVYVTEAALSAVKPKSNPSPSEAAWVDASARAPASAVPSIQEPQTPESFSKAEFSSYTYGLTKSEVRRQFGKPLIVHDSDGSWYYPSLPIYDPDAGIQVGVTIKFMGMGGPDDEVAAVRY